ncbi:hypothetical protein KC207_15875 [Phycicoccus sp. BSK3Z-2]|uniref:Uncharacterized protein n=1 Tax=Phycicoccus avicenniae TaxID=2828860 RepID=A0A941DAM1_9MICO|nr:hypothetical protein [Phycicoccus avicenniae]MBR7744775.1 hypothetical protein [Phycicoccus avicenniae]
MTGADHDRIDLTVTIDGTNVPAAWELVSEPGWYINEGRLVEHDIAWDADVATVVDRDHGEFSFQRETSDPPHYLADRAVDDGTASSRLVQFWVEDCGTAVTIRVVESGFASMPIPVDEQTAQHAQNTKTWRHQLDLARDRLQRTTPHP